MSTTNPDIRDAFFEQIYQLAKKDQNVVFMTDDLDAFVLRKFKDDFPSQFINIGVAEQTLVDVAAGLAACGKKVFIYGIASFITARCYEQLRFSICSMKLPIVVIGVGTGFSFSFDGSSHHGTSDFAITRILPEMTIFNPCDSLSAKNTATLAYKSKSPVYVRLDKGVLPAIYSKTDDFNKGFKIIEKVNDINIISTGMMTANTLSVKKMLMEKGLEVGVVDIFRIKPFSKKLIPAVIGRSKKLITIEENLLTGGIGSIISEIIMDLRLDVQLFRAAVKDRQFSVFGKREWFLKVNKLDNDSLKKAILKFCNES